MFLKIKPDANLNIVILRNSVDKLKISKRISDYDDTVEVYTKKIDNNTALCLVSFIKHIYKNMKPRYFKIEMNFDNSGIKIFFICNRGTLIGDQDFESIFFYNFFIYDNILYILHLPSEKQKQDFKLIKNRIQKINKLC